MTKMLKIKLFLIDVKYFFIYWFVTIRDFLRRKAIKENYLRQIEELKASLGME